jgi:hypothetical protein
MPYQKVQVTIDGETGEMTIEGAGFRGNECNVLDQVEASLGIITKKEAKSEKFQYVQPDYLPNQVG